ncbi:hypothetical protein TWF718_009683 [Orbilia javanica]|uniref:Uncharacterized protein n=1 Tax=Orbilia javanica TaxID=47235 RepID=A0AAN8REX4_9PEZI
MRGLEITRTYFPYGYFNKFADDDEIEELVELPSMVAVREERILWLMVKFTHYGTWIRFDPVKYEFIVSKKLMEALKPLAGKGCEDMEKNRQL